MTPTLESSLWDYIRKNMRGRWHVERLENNPSHGIPDVLYAIGHTGVMELKVVGGWPIRPATPVRINHFTPQQKGFMKLHHRFGGKVFLLLRVGREHLLFDAETALQLGEKPKQWMIDNAVRYWEKNIDFLELARSI